MSTSSESYAEPSKTFVTKEVPPPKSSLDNATNTLAQKMTSEKRGGTLATVFHFARPFKAKMVASVVCAIISVIGGLVPFIGLYQLIMLFLEGNTAMEGILFWGAVCILGYLIKILFYGISTTLSHQSAYNILAGIRYAMSEKLMRTPLGKVLSRTSGDMKNNIVDRVENIELPLAHMIPEGISNIFLPVGVVVFMILIDWRLALSMLVTVPIGFVLSLFMMRSYNVLYEDFMKASSYVNGVIVEYIEGIEVVKAFNQSSSSYEKFAHAVSSFRDFTLGWYRSTWAIRNLVGAVLPTTLLGVVPVGILLYVDGSIDIASFVLAIILALAIVNPLAWFTTAINQWKDVQYSVRAANEILHLPELSDSGKEVVFDHYDVSLKNVGFSYSDTAEDAVLCGVDLSLPQGSYTALVGPSGSGKSTVARLIARFWDRDSGSLTIGGVDVKSISIEQLSQTISFVTQDNFLFNCSLMENIRMGNPQASDEQVYAAAQAACCDEFIQALSKGYETPAGEAGKQLSGGEKQRISIARAILKDAPIVILDEATAFTDPENEDKIQQSIAELTKGKTLLVIAHRLSTVKDADNIVVLNKGVVIGQGTQPELLKTCELYREMWERHIGAKKWAASAHASESRDQENVHV